MHWQPEGQPLAETPELIVPETSAGVPDWAKIIISHEPKDDVITLLSAGTWFHPEEQDDGLVIRPPRPGPTHQPQVLFVGDELAVFHDAGGWASNPNQLIQAFIDASEEATAGRLFYAPALGTPADYAVWALVGVDLFDATNLLLAAVRGTALTVDGPMDQEAARAIYGDAVDDLTAFNLEQARAELARVRQAIRDGNLRALAERRAYAHPSAVEILRKFDHECLHMEARSPVHDTNDVPCMTWDSLWMPEVESFRRRFRDDYTPPASADILVLMPCSQRKPYKLSPTHRYFGRALDDSNIRHRCHEVMVTSPLGLVPRELEEYYPANRYDVPVTGHWNRDEEAIIREQVMALLDKKEYKHVVVHTDSKTWSVIRDILPENAIHTAHGRPSSIEDCVRLRDELRRIRDLKEPGVEKDLFKGSKIRKTEDLQASLSMQFDAATAADLCDGAVTRGRTPYVKLFNAEGEQLGQTTEGRVFLSLTLPGAHVVAKHGRKRVFQGDFTIKKTGSLFAAGIDDADGDIRPGDDVVVMRGDHVVGCGVAQMTADEMKHLKRGVGVVLRHLDKDAAATPAAPAPSQAATQEVSS